MRSYAIILGSAVYLTAAAVGCSNSGSDSRGKSADNATQPIGPSRVDKPQNGSVEVDENALHAQTHGSTLELSIPVRGVRSGAGSVTAELITVDGSKVLASAELDYELDFDEHKTLEARLALPDDVEEQADRAAYSVRVRDDKGKLRVTRSLMYVLTPYELTLEGPAVLRVERQGSYRVRAQAVPTREPIVDQAVSLEVLRDGEVAETLRGTTDDSGSAIFAVDMDTPGAYALAVASDVEKLSGEINVRESDQKLLLTTDKPIYQPGQTMHLRAMALQSPDNRPLAETKLLFEVSDGKGNKVFKKSRETNEYGIASVDFKLASLVNMGSYKLQVSGAASASAEKAVEVARYVLPKFDLKVATDKAWYQAGAELQATADARYFFGKLVSGAEVVVEAMTLDVGSQVFQRVVGKTDDQGRFPFAIALPNVLAGLPIQNGNALVTLRTTITDTAGQVVQKDTPVTVANAPIQLSLVPEATEVVPEMENRFHLFATDPLGAPVAKAKVELSGGANLSAETDDFGHAELSWKVTSGRPHIVVDVSAHDGAKARGEFSFATQSGSEHVLVRTDKSLYNLGETVRVQVIGTRSETRAYFDWLNNGQTVDMRTLELKDGVTSFEVNLDSGLIGENRIEAYVVDDDGNSVRAGRTIVVQQDGALNVQLSQDKSEYRPGEPAKLTFSVTDRAGKPAPAALGVQIVDEAVFGLIDARPGLLRSFFELEDSFAMPQYEISAPLVSFEKLLFEDAVASETERRQAAQAQAEAQLSALRNQRMMGLALAGWSETIARADAKLTPYFAEDRERLADALKPAVEAAKQQLARMGCSADNWYCGRQSADYGTLLGREVNEMFSLFDFWGTRYAAGTDYTGLTYTSAGPDEAFGNADDKTVTVSYAELGVPVGTAMTPDSAFTTATTGWAAAGAGATVAAVPSTAPGSTGTALAGDNAAAANADSPRVRSEFPETLYVNPALITDESGKAEVSLDMADSITSWRVSSLANAKGGALGGGQGAIRVFQDFFVDVAFPAELTRGDEVEFPVVVYNYLNKEQTVRIELESASWFTAMGSTSTSLTLAADSVQSVMIPVRIEKVGAQTLTVRALGASAADAVARSVRVVPDGSYVASAQSGSLAQEAETLSVNVPNNAIEGSPQLYVDVYPGLSSQVVQGLDSMLQVPTGCFEQTTSTTWPNVLVTRYLAETSQNTPEIQLKAESLISAGYQRLLTYEHGTGGFSWFGDGSGAQADLSVTSFGLMEFADMAKVSEVDPAMISRTQAWLASQQRSDGSFKGSQTEIFSFQNSMLRSTAFTAWAFAESGYTGDALDRALSFVRSELESSSGDNADTYTLALAANALAAAAPNDDALDKLLARLDESKIEDGTKVHWESGTEQTNFYGSGQDAEVSTTALIAHALVRTGTRATTAQSALEYIVGSKDANGNFGSTQASIWALKVLMLAAETGTEHAVGELSVSVDGKLFSTVSFREDEADLTTRLDMSSLASSGAHTVGLSFSGSGRPSYNLVSTYHEPWSATPPSGAAGPLAISVSYDRTTLAVDESVQANLEIRNLTPATQSMLLVTVGLPPGFELQTEELDAYVQQGSVARYERTGKQLILYITQLEGNTTLPLAYRLKATLPVRAADGGSQVALYYQPDQTASATSTTLIATAN